VEVADSLYEIYIDGIKIKGRLSLSIGTSCTKCMYKMVGGCRFYKYNNDKSCTGIIRKFRALDNFNVDFHCWVKE
jgi:hypothetical protein